MTSNIKKRIEQKIAAWEASQAFNPSWYGIFLNPFYISRSHLYRSFAGFAQTVRPGQSILDVGCGIKPYQKLFPGCEYIGIETSSSGHDDGAKTADLFFDGTIIPFEAKRFEVVMASEVFEHVENLPELTAEIFRVLKPGGTLFISMPFVWPEHEKPYDFRRFTSFGHAQLLERAGFTIASIKQTSGVFGTCGQVVSDFLIDRAGSIFKGRGLDGFRYKARFLWIRIVTIFVCAPVQLIGLLLDNIFGKKGLTLDYVVTAKKQ